MADDRSQLDEVEKDEDVEMETEDIKVNKIKDDVYLPGKSMEDDEELVHDPSAYTIYHRAQTGLSYVLILLFFVVVLINLVVSDMITIQLQTSLIISLVIKYLMT